MHYGKWNGTGAAMSSSAWASSTLRQVRAMSASVQQKVQEAEQADQVDQVDQVETGHTPMIQGEFIRLLDRMSRRLLDLVRVEMLRQNIHDINATQALMMLNIGQDEITVRDLMSRGYYLGTNASYCLKNLTENGYVERETSTRDRRSANIKLLEKGKELCDSLRRIDHGKIMGLDKAYRTLLDVERSWSDYLRYDIGHS
jgi:DNA-binding MarR family transcriptional regulator